MKRHISCFLLFAAFVAMLSSCTNTKKVAYFQNIDTLSLAASRGLYDARIMPKDELTITVSTTDPDAARPFNLGVANVNIAGRNQLNTSSGTLMGYLVDNDGNINFPVLGMLHVQGLTKRECEEMIRQKILPYMAKTENPIVKVQMSSYRISVLGEVAHPGVFPVNYEKISILEALAQAGDLTIYGKRDDVLLLREDANGEKHQIRLNLNDADLINSPYFYLQQNDVIYVTPNKAKASSSDIGQATTLTFSALSILISITSLIVNITK